MSQSMPRFSMPIVKDLENRRIHYRIVDHRDQVRATLALTEVLKRAEDDFAQLQELAHDTERTRRAIDRSVFRLLKSERDV
jgi:hypothetical protein